MHVGSPNIDSFASAFHKWPPSVEGGESNILHIEISLFLFLIQCGIWLVFDSIVVFDSTYCISLLSPIPIDIIITVLSLCGVFQSFPRENASNASDAFRASSWHYKLWLVRRSIVFYRGKTFVFLFGVGWVVSGYAIVLLCFVGVVDFASVFVFGVEYLGRGGCV